MKFLIPLLILVFWQTSFAQDYAIFNAYIILENGGREKAVLYDVTDTEMLLVRYKLDLKKELQNGIEQPIIKIPLQEIKRVSLRRRGFVGRSLIGGFALATALSSTASYFSGDDRNTDDFCFFCGQWEEKAVVSSLILGVVGAVYYVPFISIIPKRIVSKKIIEAGYAQKKMRQFSLQYQKEHWKATE